jgi:transcriptional regulator with XRE-family HTH domain
MGARNLTQQQIAAALGRSQNYVSERLRDEKPFTLDDLDALVGLFNMGVREFIRRALEHEQRVVIETDTRAVPRTKPQPVRRGHSRR